MFFKGSRYAKVPDDLIEEQDGRLARFKKIRIIAPATPLSSHRTNGAERLDQIAYRYYRDPERFWRICDCNDALWPADLVARPGLLQIPAGEE